jgi:DNA invertase Pin-like site-specific DNA recombinase
LLTIINSLRERKVAFRSLTEGMDTTTASGELLFHVFGALAQYERALTRERVVAGLAAAKRRGRVGARGQRRKDADLHHTAFAAPRCAGIFQSILCATDC